MGTPKLPPKEAFEKIRSRLQKREIFKEAMTESKPFLVKVEDSLHEIKPFEVDDRKVSFRSDQPLTLPGNGLETIGFFYVGPDRYFFNGAIQKHLKDLYVTLDTDVFKLQRRKTLRVTIPIDYPVSLVITHIDNKQTFLDTSVIDISGGGVRILFQKGDDGAMTGTSVVRGTLRTPSGKTLPFEGTVKHVLTPNPGEPELRYYGLEVTANGGLTQRMMVLTMEVQRRAVLGY